MSEDRRRLVITEDDLAPGPGQTSPPSAGGSPAGAFRLPPAIGAGGAAAMPAPSGRSFWRGTVGTSLLAALIAILPAWGALELAYTNSFTHFVRHAALEIGAFGAVFGAIYSAWDDASSGRREKALQAGLVGLLLGAAFGAASGAIAQELFSRIAKNLIESVRSVSDLINVYKGVDFYLTRALAWAIFGLGLGVAAGTAGRSGRKAVNGLAGGVVGGALGGLVFHWISTQSGISAAVSRLLGVAVVGIAIGIAIGLVELARRQSWLEVIAGGMTGKQFIVYHQQTIVGSSPKCQIMLIKDPGIQPFHFVISEHPNGQLLNSYDGVATWINGAQVSQHRLRAGDVIQVGNSVLQYSERAVGR